MAAIIRLDLDVSKMTRQGGCCTTVVVQNEIQIHQQNGERPTFIDAIISSAERAVSIPVMEVLFHTCFTLSLAS